MVRFQSLAESLKFWAENRADTPAFIFRSRKHERHVLTFKTVHSLSGRFAAILRTRLGLGRGSLVVLTLPNSPERAICEAGIIMSGAASVNGQCLLADGSDLLRTLRVSNASAIIVDPDVPSSPWDILKRHVTTVEIEEAEQDGGEGVLRVTSESLPGLKHVYFVRRVQGKGPGDFLGRLETLRDWFQADDIAPDDVVSVFLTSGTTGFSKLVVVTNQTMVLEQDIIEDFPEATTAGINVAPFGWLGGYAGYVFLFGNSRVTCDVRAGGNPEDMAEFVWRCMQEETISNALITPVCLPRLAELARSNEEREDGQDQDTDKKNAAAESERADSGETKPIARNAEHSCGKAEPPAHTENQKSSDDPPIATTACGTKGCASEAKKNTCAGSGEDKAASACCSPSQTLDKKTTCSTGCATKKDTEDGEAAPGCSSPQLMLKSHQADGSDKGSKKTIPVVFLSGQPITRSMVKAALVLASQVIVAYGSTDFQLVSTLMVSEESVDGIVDYDTGPLAKGVVVKIVSEEDEKVEVPQGQLGHILVKRSQFFDAGYLNDPETTAAALTEDDYFRTGDIGRFDSRGHLIVEGRGSEAITRGQYIFYPRWLETRISACPGVDSVIVVGVPDPFLKEELCACVVFDSSYDKEGGGGDSVDAADDDEARLARVREFVEKDIVAKEDDPLSPRPRYYLRFQSIPVTYTDKPARKLIKEKAADMLGLSCATTS